MIHPLDERPGSARRAFAPTVLFCFFFCCVTTISGATAARAQTCPPVPDAPQPVGRELRLGTRAFELESAMRLPEAGMGDEQLELDLVVRWVDPETRRTHDFTQPTRLGGTYRLTAEPDWSASGELVERISPSGTSLTALVDLPSWLAGATLGLVLALDGAAEGACPALPLTLRFTIEPDDVGSGGMAGAMPGGDTEGANPPLRVELLSQIDIMDPNSSSDVWGWNDGSTYLAILGSRTGTLFIDVTDPQNPTEAGFIPGPTSSWRDIKTYDRYAYIGTEGSGTGQGVQIVDLIDPQNPTLVNTYATNFATSHNIFIDVDRALLYIVGTNNNARIASLADPVHPVEVGAFTPRYVHDAYARGNRAYFSEIYAGRHEIIDVTNPASPQVISSWLTPDTFTHNSWVNADGTLVVTTDERTNGHLSVYDVSDPQAPGTLLSEFLQSEGSIIHNAYFDDGPWNRVAISHYTLGFKYVDLQRPGVPVELGSYDTYPAADTGFAGAWGVYAFDPRGYFYMGDIQSGLFVLEYVPSGGTLTGIVRDAAAGDGVAAAQVQVITQGEVLATNAAGEFGAYVGTGDLVLRVTANGYAAKFVDAGAMQLDGGIDVVVELEPLELSSIAGVVREAGSLLPLAGVEVGVVGMQAKATTDENGAYSLGGIPVGQRLVAAEGFGYEGTDRLVLVGQAAPAVLDLELERALFRDDLEADEGWTVSSTAISGAWVRVDPNGTGGGTVQPEHDHTPDPAVTAFVTGQGPPGGAPENGDVDGGATTLISPLLDLSAMRNPQLVYHRWFSAMTGDLDGGTLRVDINNGSQGWRNVELLTQDANAWTRIRANITDLFAPPSSFRARFVCEQFSGLDAQRILECGVDDVQVVEECRAHVLPAEPDADLDRRIDPCDPCPDDAADDADGDGLCANADNAPDAANPAQLDADLDGVGDIADNCVDVANADQRDLDGDGFGDACDEDLDGDGVTDGSDPDRDEDGIADAADDCPSVPNVGQLDEDMDGEGDDCDADDGLVHGLRVDGQLVRWAPEEGVDSYNLYRGDLGPALLLRFAGCRASDLAVPFRIDEQLPEPGSGFVYLASTVTADVEGSLGSASDGTPRLVTETCP